MNNNIILEKSVAFSKRIIKMHQYLKNKNEFVMSNQILRSGTSIGANITESTRAQSKADFYSKLNIALKEAEETKYWLNLLYSGEYIDNKSFKSISADCEEIIRILVSITKTQNSYGTEN